jgi:hypothetical protein
MPPPPPSGTGADAWFHRFTRSDQANGRDIQAQVGHLLMARQPLFTASNKLQPRPRRARRERTYSMFCRPINGFCTDTYPALRQS